MVTFTSDQYDDRLGPRSPFCLDFTHLGINSACRHCHTDPLHGADLFRTDALFLGNAKVVINSGGTTAGHGSSQTNQNRRSSIQLRFIPDSIIKRIK